MHLFSQKSYGGNNGVETVCTMSSTAWLYDAAPAPDDAMLTCVLCLGDRRW